jgi:hypothetical protein
LDFTRIEWLNLCFWRESAGEFDFHFWWFLPGYLVAVAIHAAFNQFPDRPLLAMLGVAVLAPLSLMAIFHFGEREADRWLVADRAEHQRQVDALRAGNWPDGPAAAKVMSLAERLGADGATRVRRLWELQAWLIGEAEQTMLEQQQGEADVHSGEIRAAIAEVEGLKRALGRSTQSALAALLPFSPNDYWEVAELKQRLSRR